MERRPRVPFAGQILALQIGVVTLVVGVGFALIGWLLNKELITQYEQRALAVARSVAADPVIASAAAHDDPDHIVQVRAEAVVSDDRVLYDRSNATRTAGSTTLSGRRLRSPFGSMTTTPRR